MKTMRSLLSLTLVLAMVLSLAAFAGAEGHYPVTIENVNFALEKVEFTYEKAPERVITFWNNSLETMLALGLGDRVIMAVGMDEKELLGRAEARI